MTVLSGKDLEFDYDDEEDILYVSIGPRAHGPAITCETEEGHLVRLDPDTHALIGAEIIGYRRNLGDRDIHLEWEPPARHALMALFRSWGKGDRHEAVVVRSGGILV
jgi:hypothetical protein